jgi:energy-coupling factor transporter ATP-binding protein EcfA2
MANQSILKKAILLEEVFSAFRKDPLELDELSFFMETAEVRGKPVRKRLARTLNNNPDTDERILLYGYKGCGKSTELRKLQSELESNFLVLNISINKELDPAHLQYIEIFIVTMERLFSAALEMKLPINKEYLDSVQRWSETEEIQKIKDKYFGGELEVGIETNVGIPYLQKFFAKFKASAKSSQSLKATLKQVIEPKLSDLISHCNGLIREIRNVLHKKGLKDLLIIIEDIDKAPLERSKDLFLNYVSQLTQLRANIIFTFPLALRYSPQFKSIEPYFTHCMELPMIEIRDKHGRPQVEAIKVMRDMALMRMQADLLESTDILDDMILISGGCIRDYFGMIQEAAECAMDDGRTTINRTDYDRAYKALLREYKGMIADFTPDGSKDRITADQFYAELAKIANNPNKSIFDETHVAMILRQNLLVLGYNGEGWCDVHPIVKDILAQRAAPDAS